MANDLANRIGLVASLLTVMSFMPQVWKIWREGDARALSLRMYILLVSATGLWTWFGWVIQSIPVIVTNSICFILQSSILMLKLRHRLAEQASRKRVF